MVTGAFRAGDVRYATADISRARELLGWQPRTSFEEGLEQFLAWALETELPAERSEEAMAELQARGLGGRA